MCLQFAGTKTLPYTHELKIASKFLAYPIADFFCLLVLCSCKHLRWLSKHAGKYV